MNSTQTYKEQFKTLQKQLNGHQGPLEVLRKEALEIFEAKGIPSNREESWKYTNLRKLWEGLEAPCIDEKVLFPEIQIPSIFQTDEAYRLVFTDGLLDRAYSILPKLP